MPLLLGHPYLRQEMGVLSLPAGEAAWDDQFKSLIGAASTSMYGHLSRFAAGIRPGATVRQGEVIGYVGASGLATGPHLDYRVTRNGRFVNPVSIKFEPSTPIRPELLTDFQSERDKWQSRFAALSFPQPVAIGLCQAAQNAQEHPLSALKNFNRSQGGQVSRKHLLQLLHETFHFLSRSQGDAHVVHQGREQSADEDISRTK